MVEKSTTNENTSKENYREEDNKTFKLLTGSTYAGKYPSS